MADEEVQTEETQTDDAASEAVEAADVTAEAGDKPEAEAEDKAETKAEEAQPEAVEADWRGFIKSDDAKKAAERFNSLDDVFKAVADMRKSLSDRIVIPGRDADEKEVAKFRKAMGVPESPDDYKIDLPEGMEFSEADDVLLGAVRPLAHEHNIPATALAGFVAKFKELEAQVLNEQQAAIEKQREDAEGALQEEWGKEYKANLNIANRAISQFAGDEIAEYMKSAELKSGGVLANDPNMVRLFAKLGRQMSEDGMIKPVDVDEAKDLEGKLDDLTRQAHAANAKGDSTLAHKLFAERDAVAKRLYGEDAA